LTPEPFSIPEQPVKSTVEESSISLPVSPTKYVVTVRKLPPTAEELEQARLQSTSTRKRSIDQQQNEAIAKAAFAVATDDNRPRTRRRSSAIISAVDTIILTTSIPQEDSGLTDSADF
jgi:hypothetical protein